MATFQLKTGVTVRGGLLGGDSVLSGDLSGNDVGISSPTDLIGEPSRAENSYHVVTGSGTAQTAVLDGFTITGGNANWNDTPEYRGGGMYNISGNPTVTNCKFFQNYSLGTGGGMYNKQSSPTITECTFAENCSGHGGGMFNDQGSSPQITNCVFRGNMGGDKGGGIYNLGYMHCGSSGTPSEPIIINCVFTGNWAGNYGAGIVNFCNKNGNVILINCTFSGNSTDGSGGGIYTGGYSNTSTPPTIVNSVFWDNADVGGMDESAQISGGATIDYSCVQDWTGTLGGIGNIGSDPLFADVDLRLSPGSPCIDVGDNSAVPAGIATDLDGSPRIFNGIVDMGAYESQIPTNQQPMADAGSDQIIECSCQTPEGTTVTLDGTGSYDPDGDTFSYTWTGPFEESPASGPTPTVTLLDGCVGDYEITLVVNDGELDSEPDMVYITVVDTTAPVINLNGDSTITLECGIDDYEELGATVFDLCDSTLSVEIGGDTVDSFTCGTYIVTYNATDARGNIATEATRTIIVQDATPPMISLNGPMSIELECCIDTYTEFGATVSDNCDSTVSVEIGGDTIDPSICGTYTVTYDAIDCSSNVATQITRTVIVQDTIPPEISIVAPKPYELYAVGDLALEFSATDAIGVTELWGTLTDAAGVSHTVYPDDVPGPGVYSLVLSAKDEVGNEAVSAPVFFVVYDPSGGFVTGGGWIDSPAGAYTTDPLLTGKANFSFVSKYKKGATTPTGQTEFVFKTADLNFHSSSYDWLVVTGSNYARFKGTGTINGSGEYKFMLWAGDDDPDTFRIKIWWEEGETEKVVYDNGMDQPISGGSIVIHTR